MQNKGRQSDMLGNILFRVEFGTKNSSPCIIWTGRGIVHDRLCKLGLVKLVAVLPEGYFPLS